MRDFSVWFLLMLAICGISKIAYDNKKIAESCTKDLTFELLHDNINYNCTTDRDCEMKTGRLYHP